MFKSQLLLHRPEVYEALYRGREVEMEEIAQYVPETEEDVQALLREMREAGAVQ